MNLSHSNCEKENDCALRYKYKKGWSTKKRSKQGKVLEVKCINPNDSIIQINCDMLSNQECKNSPDCQSMNTNDTFGKLKFKDALAIWPRNNIDKLQITTSKNTHGTKTGSRCKSK